MTTPACDLCGLPLRYGAVAHPTDDLGLKFCCQGCRMVYTMLVESEAGGDPARFKETELYRQCVAAGVIPADEAALDLVYRRETEGRRTDAPTPDQEATAAPSAETLPLDLVVDGMWCTACAWVIERAVGGLPGVQEATCHFSTDRLRCRYRPDRVAPDQIHTVVTGLGYTIRDADGPADGRHGQRRELIRLILSGLLSANVMMLSWALYAGFFTDLTGDAVAKISLPIVAMATVVFVYGGGAMLRRAWWGLRHGLPGMETLVSMAAGGAFGYSLFNWATGSIHLYFDTACMLITLVLLGKYLEQQAKARVRRDLDSFFALQPTKARVVTAHAPRGRYVSIAQLAPGDRFVVETDEIIPADGRIATGAATLDESSLTGEPRPIAVKTGDPIKSGSRVLDGRVTATAATVGSETILGQMITIMADSLADQHAVEGRTDRLLRWFVPTIVALALATGLVGLLGGLSVDDAMVRAVTVLVISCPCALGVAIPMAHLAGVALAGRGGILVRDTAAFDRADGVDGVVFDKTGTLTEGRWQLNRVDCRPGHDPATIIAWAAGLEQSSDHDIGQAITAYARRQGIAAAPAQALTVRADGIAGMLAGHRVRIGNRRFAWSDAPPAGEDGMPSDKTPVSRVFVSVDDQPAAQLIFGDRLRAGVDALVDALRRDGKIVHLISGDGDAATRAVGRAIGVVEARGGLLPADKAAYIDALAVQQYRVAMVGDGINDAVAMTRAHLAVAVHAGRSLAKEAAHITLMRGDPAQLLTFLTLARRVNRKVIQNLWCAWIYNLVSIPVAMSGLLTPLVAATAMLLSSLTVIGNTLLLVRRN